MGGHESMDLSPGNVHKSMTGGGGCRSSYSSKKD